MTMQCRACGASVAIAFGAALTLGAPASAQNLEKLLPVIKELATQDEDKLSDDEIRDRSVERGVGTLLESDRPTPRSVFRSYKAYKDEKRALEERERRRKAAKRRKVIDAIGGFLGSVGK